MKVGKRGRGALSFETDRDNRKVIDVSELRRFYGEIKVNVPPETGHNAETPQRVAPELAKVLRERIGDLEGRVGELNQDKQKLHGIIEKQQKIIEQQQTLLLPAPKQEKKRGLFGLFGR